MLLFQKSQTGKAQMSALLAASVPAALWSLDSQMAQGTDCNSSPWWPIGQVCTGSLCSVPAPIFSFSSW